MIGGLLVGSGFTLMSSSNSYAAWVIGFGVLAGAGFGFGYAAATPPALKWFSSTKTGVIAGIVVAGFGLAPVYIAPLASYLLGAYGMQKSMMFLAVGFTVVVCGLSFLLVNPPQGFVPAEPAKKDDGKACEGSGALTPMSVKCFARRSSISSGSTSSSVPAPASWLSAALPVLAKKSMGSMAFVAVAIMAIGNASGRVIAGLLSDKIGRKATLTIMLAFQAILMFAAIPVVGSGSGPLLVLLATFIGFNYGSNLCLFPSFAKDYWGFKNYGLNYGALFTAWGVGGFVMGRVSEMMNAHPGGLNKSFILAGTSLPPAPCSLSSSARRSLLRSRLLLLSASRWQSWKKARSRCHSGCYPS